MLSFDYLKDVLFPFSFSKCDKNSRTKKLLYSRKKINHFEQTLKLLKCEEKVNYAA